MEYNGIFCSFVCSVRGPLLKIEQSYKKAEYGCETFKLHIVHKHKY